MDAEEFLNILSECDVLREDIDEVRERVALTASEGNRLAKIRTPTLFSSTCRSSSTG